MTIREPRWTALDQAEVLALAEYRASLCSCCGLPKDSVLVHERDAPKYVVSKRYCLARRTLAETQAAFFKEFEKNPKPEHQALQWSVRIEKR
jgi:hypothetical protein